MQQTSNLIDDWNLTTLPPTNTGHHHTDHDRDDPAHAPTTNPAYDFAGVMTPTAVATDPSDGDDLADFLNTPATAPDSAIAHPPAHNEFDDFAMFASSAPPGPDAEPDVGFPVMDNVATGLRKGMDEFASFREDDELHVDEFGDFGERKGEEEVVASGEMKIVDLSNEGDFLGDFDEGKVEVTVSAEVKVVNSSNEDEFGDFDGEKVEVKMAVSAQMEVKDVNNGDDFGDFGQEKMDVVSEHVKTEDVSMDDDFGDLGEGKMDVVVSTEVDVVDVNNEDDFGNFDEGSVYTEARAVGVSDDDDFGDFGEGSMHVEARAADATNDDDFGDFDEGQMSLSARPRDAGNTDAEFGDFDEAAPPERELEPPKRIVPIDPVEMKSLASLLASPDSASSEILPHLTSLFDRLFPRDPANGRFTDTLMDSSVATPAYEEEAEGIMTRPNDMTWADKERARRRKSRRQKVLCTQCSDELWNKLSRDAVFYNPITGSVGQFQWSRSHTHREYLTALGVKVNLEEIFRTMSPTLIPGFPHDVHDAHDNPLRHATAPIPRSTRSFGSARPTPGPSTSSSSTHHPPPVATAATAAAVMALAGLDDGAVQRVERQQLAVVAAATATPEEEPELDLDIARAYCELTEDTLHVFPITKLQAMAQEMARLHRQATEYLEYLLDQREQLLMDSETYNDLISCIVGHAQRIREQTPKDATAAKVSKRKNGTSSLHLSSLSMKRKTPVPTAPGGVSMGGGVVGVVGGAAGVSMNANGAGPAVKLLGVAGGGGKGASGSRRLSM